MNNGWIKLYRQFLQWEWYDDINTKILFIHLLLKANYKKNSWHGIKIKRGQLITGLHSLSYETKLSVKQIRTCLQKLQKTGEINKQSGNQFSIITVCNYEQYNNIKKEEGKQEGKQRASKGQAKGNTLRKKERKESKNNINIPFEKFWDKYGKKVGDKQKCKKQWENLKNQEREKIMGMLPQWEKSIKDKQYQPYPSTFLNQRRWENEDETKKQNISPAYREYKPEN